MKQYNFLLERVSFGNDKSEAIRPQKSNKFRELEDRLSSEQHITWRKEVQDKHRVPQAKF